MLDEKMVKVVGFLGKRSNRDCRRRDVKSGEARRL